MPIGGTNAKQKYQVTNWAAYNESLRQRGDLTIWVKDEALSLWTARRRTSRSGQLKYGSGDYGVLYPARRLRA